MTTEEARMIGELRYMASYTEHNWCLRGPWYKEPWWMRLYKSLFSP